ncbi:MAG: glutathione S-transferase, partial [Pseudoalteromonas sp.]
IADITLYAGLVFAGFAQIAIPNELTHLVAWQEKVAKRPSVAA